MNCLVQIDCFTLLIAFVFTQFFFHGAIFLCMISAVNKDMTLTGTETHYEDLDTSTPGYRRRIVNAVADLSENFKGMSLQKFRFHITNSSRRQNVVVFL